VSTTPREPHLINVSIDIFRLIDATLFRWLNQYIRFGTIAARRCDTLQRCIGRHQAAVWQTLAFSGAKENGQTHISGNALITGSPFEKRLGRAENSQRR
jgi:hypothetical protein